ncbi:g9096 [Coccomyxa elongata]
MTLTGWCDLPSDIWELIFHNLISTDQLYSLSCAAEALAALGQVCKHTRGLAAQGWEDLAAGSPSVPQCPLTSLPFVFGLDSSASGERGIFSVSRHGRQLEWGTVAAELHRGRDSQVNFGPTALQTCLCALGIKRASSWGNAEECAAELRARLPAPQLMGSCRVPYRLVLEVRRLRCEMVPAPEAKRRFHLTDSDLKRLTYVKDPLPLNRSCRRPQYWLLDVQRAARAKFGSEAAMLRQARRNRELASRPHRANSSGQQGRQRQLQAVLASRRLKVEDGYLAAQRYIQGPVAVSEAVAQGLQGLDEVVAAIERRRFITAHCSAERALALAACQWAAQEMEGQALKDKKLLAWEEQLKREGLLDWLQGAVQLQPLYFCH